MKSYSIIIPAYNEEKALAGVLTSILALPLAMQAEIIVIDDHSSDKTLEIASSYPVTVLSNVQNFGYGYSLKRGIAAAKYENVIITDADGSYPPESLLQLVTEYEKGFDMVVGARQGVHYKGSLVKSLARFFFRILSEFATGRSIPDINSGCRVFRRDLATNFFHTLSSGFSFTTTVTLAFMLNAYSVAYIPIEYHKRAGESKVRYIRDTLRSGQIIIEAIIFYNPLKIFLLVGMGVVLLGLISFLVSLFWPLVGLYLFLTFATVDLVVSLGFVTVFLRFVNERS